MNSFKADAVRSFRPADKVTNGEFELVISVGGQVFRITLQLNYDTGTVAYHTARAETQAAVSRLGMSFRKN